MEYEDGINNISELKTWFSGHKQTLNEATTRARYCQMLWMGVSASVLITPPS